MSSSFGTVLKIAANAVAKLKSIGGINITRGVVDVTTHDSADEYKEYMAGLKDGGEVPISGILVPTDTDGQNALQAALESGAVTAFAIVFPTAIGYTWSFNGIVTSYATTQAELEGAVGMEAKIKVSGKPTLAATV
jgi:predicted secreted protein